MAITYSYVIATAGRLMAMCGHIAIGMASHGHGYDYD